MSTGWWLSPLSLLPTTSSPSTQLTKSPFSLSSVTQEPRRSFLKAGRQRNSLLSTLSPSVSLLLSSRMVFVTLAPRVPPRLSSTCPTAPRKTPICTRPRPLSSLVVVSVPSVLPFKKVMENGNCSACCPCSTLPVRIPPPPSLKPRFSVSLLRCLLVMPSLLPRKLARCWLSVPRSTTLSVSSTGVSPVLLSTILLRRLMVSLRSSPSTSTRSSRCCNNVDI